MAQASRKLRKLRRIKRERTMAFKGMDIALRQRDQARLIAGALERELKKYTDDPFPEDAPPPAKREKNYTITKLEDEETSETNG